MKSLIFVYNGDSGIVNSLMHLMHKAISPETYECQLCSIIYDGISQSKEWKAFIQHQNIKAEYFHRDTFVKSYGEIVDRYPVVLLKDNDSSLKVVIDAKKFSSIQNMEQLKAEILKIVNSKIEV